MVDPGWKQGWSEELRRATSSCLSTLLGDDYDGFVDMLAFWEAFRLLSHSSVLMNSCVKAFAATRACATRTGDDEFDALFNRGISKGKLLFKDVYLLSQLLNHYLNPHKRLCGDPEGKTQQVPSAQDGNPLPFGGMNTAIVGQMNNIGNSSKIPAGIPIHELTTLRGSVHGGVPLPDNNVTGSMKRLNLIKSAQDLSLVHQLFCNNGDCTKGHLVPLYNKVPFLSLGNFMIFYKINEGSSGKVHIGFHKLHRRTYALKLISKAQYNGDNSLFRRLRDEMNLATSMSHPNIVRTFELLETSSSLIIAMEYCDGGDLIGIIKDYSPMTESMARVIFRMVLNGINYLHESNICHRDIKPENIFLKRVANHMLQDETNGYSARFPLISRRLNMPFSNYFSTDDSKRDDNSRLRMDSRFPFPGSRNEKSYTCSTDASRQSSRGYLKKQDPMMPYTVKIGDFGAATRITEPKGLLDTVGTMSYAAPEVLGCGGIVAYCGKQADIWSLGVLLYAMLFGELPWHNEKVTLREAVHSVVNKPPSFPSHISPTAKNLIQGMLQVNPTKRLSTREVMGHPWFTEQAVDEILYVKKIRTTLSRPV